MAWGQAILVAAHLAWAGWGMSLLLRRLGRGELAQTVGGLAFSLSGYLVARAHFLSINAAVAWLPWILLAAFNLAHEPKRTRNFLWLALALAMQWLVGHAQTAWYTLLLAIAWLIFWAWRGGKWSQVWRAALAFAAASASAFALSTVQLLPTAEYLLNSQRATQVDFSQAAMYSFWPWRLLTAFAPNFFGNPAYGNYWGYGNYWEDAIYIGVPALLLALWVIFRIRRVDKDRPLFIFLIILIGISLLLALGSNTPFYEWLFVHVPTFALFQSPARFTIWLVFGLAALAAFGVDAWRRPTGRSLYWSRLAAVGTMGIIGQSAIAVWLASSDGITRSETFAWACLPMGVAVLGMAILNLFAPADKAPKPRWAWLVALLLAADLLYAGWGLNPSADLALYNGSETTAVEGRTYMFSADEQALKFDRLFRFDSFSSADPAEIRERLLPNVGILDGILSANNFDPFVPARYQDWMDRLQTASPEQQYRMLEKMAVTRVLLRDDSPTANGLAGRARWQACARVIDDRDEALQHLDVEKDGQPAFVIERIDPAADNLCAKTSPGWRALSIIEESANRVIVSLAPHEGGWLVLADTWYPGWHAYAGDKELTIYPADGIFRAVYVEAGLSSVEFRYEPITFYAGLAISAAAWLAVALAWVWIRQPRYTSARQRTGRKGRQAQS